MWKRVLAIVLLGVLLTGCASHVSVPSSEVSGTAVATLNGVSFSVPASVASAAVDYHTLINVPYMSQEDIDTVYSSLVMQTITGTEAESYLLTNSRECLFYVVALSDLNFDISTADRNAVVRCFDIDGFTPVTYGRLITNSDATQKAVMRLDFQVADAMGVKNTYQGYCSLSNIGGIWHGYLAGYKSADAEQLKMCFNCVRSVG